MKQPLINFVKGAFIGIGGLLPGLSGGALATIFGLYEPFIHFLSDIKKNTKKQVLFFAPVVLGGVFGVFLLSHALSYFLTYHLAEISVFFIGTMLAIFPNLIKQAGAKGRHPIHVVLTVITALSAFLFLVHVMSPSEYTPATTPYTWTLSGALIGLGVTFPGLSPSNFLMYFNLYEPLSTAVANLDLTVIIPVAFGGLLSVLLTGKLVAYLLKIAYTTVYHIILGLVLTSTVMIIPRYFPSPLLIAFSLFLGLTVGRSFTLLEQIEITQK